MSSQTYRAVRRHFHTANKLKNISLCFVLIPSAPKCSERFRLYKLSSLRPDMHNIRPAGQMWPAEAFYLARKAQDFAFVAFIFPRNIL